VSGWVLVPGSTLWRQAAWPGFTLTCASCLARLGHRSVTPTKELCPDP